MLYLIYNEGYPTSSGDQLVREDLSTERFAWAGCSSCFFEESLK